MAEASLKKINIDCGDYVWRTVEIADASDRWGEWLGDPEAALMLNTPPATMSKREVEDYVRKFDQRTHLLIGIFEKAPNKLVGFLRIDIDEPNKRFLVSMLIGEPEHRDKGVLQAGTVAMRDYLYETLGLKTQLATVLSHNERTIHYLRKTGWTLDRVQQGHSTSRHDGRALDLYYFSQTREQWRAWKKAHVPERERAISSDKRDSKKI
jgi:RimJ/RimL family protein N-acetyltransferase